MSSQKTRGDISGHDGISGHGDRKGRHYYTRKQAKASYSSGDPCGRHVLAAVAMFFGGRHTWLSLPCQFFGLTSFHFK